MKTKITDADLQNIIDYLQGTCMTLQAACQAYGYEEDDLTAPQLEEIDSQIFLCTTCGWWYEIADSSEDSPDGENVCIECIEEIDEDENED